MWIERTLTQTINKVQKSRPALLLSGARQTGKSSLLKRMFPGAESITLDRVLTAQNAEENPASFLSQFKSTVILDECEMYSQLPGK
jgi:hypothetical protein